MMFFKRNAEKNKITIKELENMKETEKVFKPVGKNYNLRENVYFERERSAYLRNRGLKIIKRKKF